VPITALAMMLATMPAIPADWNYYTNPRFAFSICYPKRIFTPGREPDNGDGLSFAAKDGAKLSAWGGNDALDEGLAGERRKVESNFTKVTYRAQGSDWFVVSGTTGARIVYHKTFLSAGRFVSFDLSYPAGAATRYKPIVAQMQKCFRYDPIEG
jgi:hypothetical protein